ncbi:MAG: archaeosortase/exosortase family protein, partial [Anaerolineae bacterium]
MLRTADTHPWRIADTNWLQVGAQLALAGLWLALFRPVGDYLLMILSHEHYHTNQIMLIGILVLAVQQMVGRPLRLRLDAPPRLHWPPLLLALGASLGFLIVERFLDVNSFSAVLAGLATYGLLGLWMPLPAWRRSLPVALLLIGVLPFGDHLQTFIGYPMRIVTAAIVRDGLAAVGVHTVGVDTILVFENGISQVDIPCSGVKSLWSGMMFLLAATWIRHKPINLRWLLVAGVFGGLLFAANLARVAALVVVGPVAGWPLLAEMLHLPLGVLGFVAACAAAVALLDRWVAHATTPG